MTHSYLDGAPSKTKHVLTSYFSSLQWSLSIWFSVFSSWNIHYHSCSYDIHRITAYAQ